MKQMKVQLRTELQLLSDILKTSTIIKKYPSEVAAFLILTKIMNHATKCKECGQFLRLIVEHADEAQ